MKPVFQRTNAGLFEAYVRHLADAHALNVYICFDIDLEDEDLAPSTIAAYDVHSLRVVAFTEQLNRMTEEGIRECAKHEMAHAYAHQFLGLQDDDNEVCHSAPQWFEACEVLGVNASRFAPTTWMQPQYRLGEILGVLEPRELEAPLPQ